MHNSGGVISQPGLAEWLLSTSYKWWVDSSLYKISLCQRRTRHRARDGFSKSFIMKLLCHCQLHCDGDIFPLFVQNMTLIFSSNWDKIKSSPCKWISPLGTAYWILGISPPPPPANMSVALPCFLRWSLVAKSLCVFVSYHIPHQHRNTTIRERSPLIGGVSSESYIEWMQSVPSVLQE